MKPVVIKNRDFIMKYGTIYRKLRKQNPKQELSPASPSVMNVQSQVMTVHTINKENQERKLPDVKNAPLVINTAPMPDRTNVPPIATTTIDAKLIVPGIGVVETFCADEKGNKVSDHENIRIRTTKHLGVLRQAAAMPSKSASSDFEFYKNAPLDIHMLFAKPAIASPHSVIPEESLLDDDPNKKRFSRSEDNKNNSAVGNLILCGLLSFYDDLCTFL